MNAEDRGPVRVRSFAARYGCLLVLVLGLATLISGIVAVRHPRPGIPAALAGFALTVFTVIQITRQERAQADRKLQRLRDIVAPRGDAWKRLLAAEGLGRLEEGLRPRVRTALRLETRALEAPPALLQSRIGGLPGLPEDLAWPRHQDLPMMFLAQLDLADVARAAPGTLLPQTGHLFFFYSLAQPWGFDPADAGSCRVIYQPPGFTPKPLRPPEGLPVEAQFKACGLHCEAYEDLPVLEDPAVSERTQDICDYLANGGEGPGHKLLGHANPIQGPMEEECQLVSNGINCGSPAGYQSPQAEVLKAGSSDWRLLLQLDTDHRPGIMWGDAGRLYFWIQEADLKACRFEKTWLILQCG